MWSVNVLEVSPVGVGWFLGYIYSLILLLRL